MYMGQYNIQVLRGLSLNRSLLSCQENNGVVDLWTTDDSSGRQRWDVNMIDSGVFTFKVSGVTDPSRVYLVFDDLDRVKLGEYSDNNAGWRVIRVATTPEIPAYYAIAPFDGPEATRLLSCTPDGTRVDLFSHDDESGRQRWQFQGPPMVNAFFPG